VAFGRREEARRLRRPILVHRASRHEASARRHVRRRCAPTISPGRNDRCGFAKRQSPTAS